MKVRELTKILDWKLNYRVYTGVSFPDPHDDGYGVTSVHIIKDIYTLNAVYGHCTIQEINTEESSLALYLICDPVVSKKRRSRRHRHGDVKKCG